MASEAPRTEIVQLTPEQIKSRRARNVAIALAVCALVVLFYVVTIAKLGLGVLNKGVW
ncbi:MAG: hypothetical protein ACO27F_03835 [Beijerinckiaceae bacterium]|jgi:hypothetical protein